MKKKPTTPLTLNRETLRQLSPEQLSHRAQGGEVVHSDLVVNFLYILCASGPRSGFC